MESKKNFESKQKNLKILVKSPPEEDQEEKGIEIFKALQIPNLEKIIQSSQNLYSDFLNFAGELWNHNNSEKPPVRHRKSNSSGSVSLDEPSSNIIILRKLSSIQGSVLLTPSKPKKIRSSKSFAPINSKIPFLQIEDDVQPQVASIRNQSLIDNFKLANSESHIGHLSSIANLNSLEYNGKNSIVYKEISILPGLFDSVLESENDYNSVERPGYKPEELGVDGVKGMSEMVKCEEMTVSLDKVHAKTQSQGVFNGIPDLFDINAQSVGQVDKRKLIRRSNRYALETAPDLPDSEPNSIIITEEEGEEQKNPESLLSKSVDESFDQLFKLIPRSILYQIPILTFEEFINSLMNDEIKTQKGILWTVNSLRQLFNKCCCNSLNSEDFKICEKIILFSMTRFNFQNSLHLILLLSCFKSVTKSDRWPHKQEDWYEMGFSTDSIEKELMQNGTACLLNIFFLASYFPSFFSEMLRVRRYYSFDLFEIISSISQIALTILRKNKLSGLIKANGRALEVIFFFFAGIMLYWFKKLVKSKDYLKIYDSTVKKASQSMSELLKEAWRVYLENQNL